MTQHRKDASASPVLFTLGGSGVEYVASPFHEGKRPTSSSTWINSRSTSDELAQKNLARSQSLAFRPTSRRRYSGGLSRSNRLGVSA